MADELVEFNQYPLRGIIIEGQWYYAVVDVIKILTDSTNPAVYWRVMKKRAGSEGFEETLKQLETVRLKAADGKLRDTEVANRQTLLRLVQSIPSSKAEPFRLWLAEAGEEKLQQVEDRANDEKRLRAEYRAKGYDEKWIDQRIESDTNRNRLTDEWTYRGAKDGREFAILTNVINEGTFDLTVAEHKSFKTLPKNANLRDHMTRVELALISLGEATAEELHEQHDSQGFDELHRDAKAAGRVGGGARKLVEQETGESAVSSKNFLPKPKKKNKLEQTSMFDLLPGGEAGESKPE